jgi:hypothetical protein
MLDSSEIRDVVLDVGLVANLISDCHGAENPGVPVVMVRHDLVDVMLCH